MKKTHRILVSVSPIQTQRDSAQINSAKVGYAGAESGPLSLPECQHF